MFTPLPSDCKKRILCYYRNPTDRVQIARILDVPNWCFERIVFPKQRLCFEATLDAHLEIHTGSLDRTTVLETSVARGNECCGHFCKIPCRLLQVEEDMGYSRSLIAKSKRELLEESYTSAVGSKCSKDLAG